MTTSTGKRDFRWALDALRNGRYVTRDAWAAGTRLSLVRVDRECIMVHYPQISVVVTPAMAWFPALCDILAYDWREELTQ